MKAADRSFDVVCLSHLKWEQTLFQRPQQIMRRLSRRHRVLYLANCGTKEFVRSVFKGDFRFFVGRDSANLFYLNIPFPPFAKHIRLFQDFVFYFTIVITKILSKRFGFKNVYAWVFHPCYLPHLKRLPHEKLIYDCMDLFSGFERATAGVILQEIRLLKKADIVFTGGKSLQKAKEGVNPRTYCFPSGVEYEHFHKAALPQTPIPEDIGRLQRPILGYFGAVDERLDYDLLNYLCVKMPDCSVVLIGPLILGCGFVPVDQPNFHFLGKKEYDSLPEYLKAFDVCLMPFVISELTRHISPTKTPEYLAGGKPVVSTAIPDVIEDYSDLVKIARDFPEFAAQVREALNEENADLHLRLQNKAEAKSWEHIVEEMERLLAEL